MVLIVLTHYSVLAPQHLSLTRLNELLSAMMFIEYHHACLNNSHHLEVCIHYNTLDQDSYIAEFESVSGVSAIEGLLKY